MSPLLDVPLRPAEATYEKIAQAHPGGFQFLCRVHRAKDFVAGDLFVEGPREAIESILPEDVE